MKKIITTFILLLGIACLCACSNDNDTDPSTTTDIQTTVETSVENTSETISETIVDADDTKNNQTETTKNNQAKTTNNTTEATTTQNIPEYVPGTVKLLPRIQPFGPETTKFEYKRKYRLIYYSTVNFDEIAQEMDPERYEEWCEYVYTHPEHEKEFTEMRLVTYIKFFNIPKDVFKARIEYWKQRQREAGYDPDCSPENGELPNVDVLYTFDNEIINRYYRYE